MLPLCQAGDVGREQLPKVATAFLKFLEDASLFYRRLIMRLQSVFGDVGVKVELPQGLAHGGPGGHGSHSPGSSMVMDWAGAGARVTAVAAYSHAYVCGWSWCESLPLAYVSISTWYLQGKLLLVLFGSTPFFGGI